MTREEAYYHKILLMTGFTEGYDAWLNEYLEREDPLSDIVLELSCCGSDRERVISCLHGYCLGMPFDSGAVCDSLRLFLKQAYHDGTMSKGDVISTMYRFANAHGDPGDAEFYRSWNSMFYMADYAGLAEDGILLQERFDEAFDQYLNDGVLVDIDRIWTRPAKTKSVGNACRLRDWLFAHLKKHKCPVCGERLAVVEKMKMALSVGEKESFARRIGKPYFSWIEFRCDRCHVDYPFEEIKMASKTKRNK